MKTPRRVTSSNQLHHLSQSQSPPLPLSPTQPTAPTPTATPTPKTEPTAQALLASKILRRVGCTLRVFLVGFVYEAILYCLWTAFASVALPIFAFIRLAHLLLRSLFSPFTSITPHDCDIIVVIGATANAEAIALVSQLGRAGCNVVAADVDVMGLHTNFGDYPSVRCQPLAVVKTDLPRLREIVHSSGKRLLAVVYFAHSGRVVNAAPGSARGEGGHAATPVVVTPTALTTLQASLSEDMLTFAGPYDSTTTALRVARELMPLLFAAARQRDATPRFVMILPLSPSSVGTGLNEARLAAADTAVSITSRMLAAAMDELRYRCRGNVHVVVADSLGVLADGPAGEAKEDPVVAAVKRSRRATEVAAEAAMFVSPPRQLRAQQLGEGRDQSAYLELVLAVSPPPFASVVVPARARGISSRIALALRSCRNNVVRPLFPQQFGIRGLFEDACSVAWDV